MCNSEYGKLKKYGTKIFGMHQKDLISNLYDEYRVSAGPDDPPIISAIQGGMCAALVAYWLHDFLVRKNNQYQLRPTSPERKLSKLEFKRRFTVKLHGISKIIASTHASYVRLYKKPEYNNQSDLIIITQEMQGGNELKTQVDVITKKFNELESYEFKHDSGYYVVTEFKESNHGIGIVRKGHHLYFYDPNAGEYKIHKDNDWKQFMSTYREIKEKRHGAIMQVRVSSARAR